MDPNVVNSRIPTIKSALQSIPTISVVTDLSNLVDPGTGIYVHAGGSRNRLGTADLHGDPQ
jgi:hypothetical protein